MMNLVIEDHNKPFAIYGWLNPLVSTVYTFSEDIGMEFGKKKCGIVVLKQGKVDKVKSRGWNLPNGKLMKVIYEEGYKYLGIIGYDKVKEKEMKI